MPTRTVTFETQDGVTLTGDLEREPDSDPVRFLAIVCHPHPQYGGDRFNPVVKACCRDLSTAGALSLRFDFRARFGGGVAEREDVLAALALLRACHPSAPLALVGYSFGAMVSLNVDDRDLVAKVLIAPPLTMMRVNAAPAVPTLVLMPAHDQFTPPDDAISVVDDWRVDNPDVMFETIEMADHFLVGRIDHVARRTADWLTATILPTV